MRADNTRLAARLERLETGSPLGAPSPKHHAETVNNSPLGGSAAIPQLTVVKLRPKHEPAPKLSTQVAIIEPSVDSVAALKSASVAAAADGPEPQDGETLFDQGVAALKTGNVEGGVEQLQRFAVEQPKHPKADNALYWSGLGLMGLNDLDGASKAFESVLSKYPAGDAVQDSMLKLAECRNRLKHPSEAKAMYQKIVSDYPGSPAASAAQAELSALK